MAHYTVAGINFAHFHMGDNLRMVEDHPDTEIVAVCDEEPDESTLGVADTAAEFDIPEESVYDDHVACLEETEPDIVVLCPVPSEHAEWVEKVAPYGADIVLEKPFATSVADAERMLEAVDEAGVRLAVNWPLAWYPPHRTTKRLIDEGEIGEVVEIHYYDGNKGSGRFEQVEYSDSGELHFAGGDQEDVASAAKTWWHQADRGGGSLYDYLGYGVTLGTWFRDGELPNEVTTDTYLPDWSPVDTHSITIAKYDAGLSKYETRWGTFTDPWVNQPQPKCGFVVVGTEGTISSYDYEGTIRVQTADDPDGYELDVDELETPLQNPIQYVVDCIEGDHAVEFGPLNPELCRDAQRIVDAAKQSAERGETVSLGE
ncbi:Gfo/Idh/MocA family protein [Halococcus sp. IIIV-5B]|uniref:Gfo/Idh/MocA family protein n=1 Tax=Halococcus sp. IIIV-5B TaxID=2321230 RepID=UPI000E720476|nr:Gfo/Idh/MocA family oxidoreductase [Halococcus sp. IIIV-5B]RJT01479.1 gfo/Idh/MocA family oxidoreductase [Halococcus sp. IIIV-5B]